MLSGEKKRLPWLALEILVEIECKAVDGPDRAGRLSLCGQSEWTRCCIIAHFVAGQINASLQVFE